jgi:hypothetical protein
VTFALLQGTRVVFIVLSIGLFFRLRKQWKARRQRRLKNTVVAAGAPPAGNKA